jgi:serine phosphatase RsbU (regulator of sigma subunit)
VGEVAAHQRRAEQAMVFVADDAQEEETARWLVQRRLPSARIRLEELAEQHLRAYGDALVGDRFLPPQAFALAKQKAHSSPGVFREIVHAMLAQGVLRLEWAGWFFDEHAKFEAPSDRATSAAMRVASLSDAHRRILAPVAVHPWSFDEPQLAIVAGCTETDARKAAAAALEVGLLSRTRNNRLELLNASLADALGGDLAPNSRAPIHDAWARTLDAENPSDLYTLAAHVAAGSAPSTQAAIGLNLRACTLAFSTDYDFERALHHFETARTLATELGATLPPESFATAAEVQAMRGRLDLAGPLFQRAITESKDRMQRAEFRDRYVGQVLTPSYETLAAGRELDEAKQDLGAKRRPAVWRLFAAFYWLAVSFLVGWLVRGRVSPAARRRFTLESRLERRRVENAYFLNDMIEQTYGIARSLWAATRVGRGMEYNDARAMTAVSLTYIGLGGLARGLMRDVERDVATLNQPRAFAHNAWLIGAYYELRGENSKAHELWGGTIAERRHWLDPYNLLRVIDTYAMFTGSFGSLEHAEELMMTAEKLVSGWNLGDVERSKPLRHIRNHLALVLAYRNKRAEALEMLPTDLSVFHEHWLLGSSVQSLLGTYTELREPPEAVERLEPYLAKLYTPVPTYEYRFVYVQLSRYWLHRACIAKSDAERDAMLVRARACIDKISRVMPRTLPNLYLNPLALGACIDVMAGRGADAWERLGKAILLAGKNHVPSILFDIHYTLAHTYRQRGHVSEAKREAMIATGVATAAGQLAHLQWLQAEFGVGDMSKTTPGMPSSAGVPSSIVQDVHAKRKLSGLLNVAVASIGVTDPHALGRIVLDEILRLFHAERAFLFMKEGETMRFRAGRNSEGGDVTEASAYSGTIIQRTVSEKRALILSGTDQGLLSTESAVVYGLRSIATAPLLLRGDCIGTVYVDSRAVKGIFNEADADLLSALANQIAAAIESSRAAQVEIERSKLSKDLELAAAVQSMLLPAQSECDFGAFSLVAYYRTASQSGGDWWTHRNDGEREFLLVGDITGHGAGAAMMTAVVAGCDCALRNLGQHTELRELITSFHETLKALGHGSYNMTMFAAQLSRQAPTLSFLSMGAPPVLRMKTDGSVLPILAPGTPLGSDPLRFDRHDVACQPGERILIFTDGFSELKLKNGVDLGMRRLAAEFAATRRLSLVDARQKLADAITNYVNDVPQEDDITFVILEANAPR